MVAFLSSLATEDRVAASTQNQALSAVVFLYREVMGVELDWLNGLVRARRPERLPVVLTRDEVRVLLAQLTGSVWLMASLMYGAGLRLLESGTDIRTIQELLGHRDVSTTIMIYTPVVNRGGLGVRSPLDS